jgi:hypothetical protein
LATWTLYLRSYNTIIQMGWEYSMVHFETSASLSPTHDRKCCRSSESCKCCRSSESRVGHESRVGQRKATISCCFQSLSRILPSKCRQVYVLSTALVHTTAEQDGLNKTNLEKLQILITHLHSLFRRPIVIQKKKIQYMVLGLSIGPTGSIQRFFISYY